MEKPKTMDGRWRQIRGANCICIILHPVPSFEQVTIITGVIVLQHGDSRSITEARRREFSMD